MTTEGFEALVALEAAADGGAGGAARWVARLLGAGEAQRERMGAPLPPSAQAGHAAVVATLQRVLGPAAFAAARTAGHALPFAEALAQAVQAPTRGAEVGEAEGSPAARSAGPSGRDLLDLTEREVEVLRLVAAGLTNKEIATHLALSPRTEQAQLNRIFGKLDVTTRSGAARAAADRGLI
jgi:DNA-binding NarL/FixJ family response regulator